MAKRRSSVMETNEPTESAETGGDTAAPAETVPAQAPPADEPVKKTRVRKALDPLDFASLKVVVVTNADTMRDFKRSRGTRHPEQVAVDNLVRKAYDTWIQAGMPTTWNECRGLLLTVPEDQFNTLKTRIQRAGSFFDFAIRFSDVKHGDGHAEVLLVVKDKTAKSENPTDVDDDDDDVLPDDFEENESESESESESDSEPEVADSIVAEASLLTDDVSAEESDEGTPVGYQDSDDSEI